ncbi:MAG: hypothetical protein KC708_18530, partial [Anaerolineae bacterium]|nr:hypothetical protein [Anaerolineae bacterium]
MVDKPQWLYSQNEIFWQGKLKYPVNWDEITVNLQVRYNAEPFNPLFRYSCGFILVAAILGMVMSAFIIIQVMANEFVSSGFTFYMIVFSGFVIAEVLGIR